MRALSTVRLLSTFLALAAMAPDMMTVSLTVFHLTFHNAPSRSKVEYIESNVAAALVFIKRLNI